MLLISLDEGGRFEQRDVAASRRGCMMIGGALFNGTVEGIRKESDRLLRFFETVCLEQGCTYPTDLHYNWDRGMVSNAGTAGRVKTALAAQLPDFLNNTGRWHTGYVNGTYSVYALVGDARGMASMRKPGLSNLIDDAVGGNRYEHMAYRAVQNLLFYDLGNTETDIRLDLATRVIMVNDPTLYAEVEKLGLKPLEQNTAKRRLTDTGSFRAMLSQSILDSDRSDLSLDLNVQSIHYNASAAYRQAFLYLADTLCSVYQDAIGDTAACDNAIEKLETCCRQLVGNRFRIWAYHDMDEEYRRAVRSYCRKDYFDALLRMQKIRAQKSTLSGYYDRAWLKGIERRITVEHDPERLKLAIIQLEDYLNTPGCDLTTAIAIHQVLVQQWRHMSEEQMRAPELMFTLSKNQMTICNHTGNYTGAMQAYQECLRYAQYVSVEDYLQVQNMLAVAQSDAGTPAAASDTISAGMTYEQMLLGIKQQIYPDCSGVHIHYGRTCSQQGQYYAFAGQYDQACASFRKAIAAFGENEVQIARTRSYYLHALIEAGDEAAYRAEAAVYFDADQPLQQYQALARMDDASTKFALYVFMKALFIFCRGTQSASTLRTIIKGVVKRYESHADHHPWQMIMKYAAFIMLDRKLTIEGITPGMLMQMAQDVVKEDSDGILVPIVAQGRLQAEQVSKGQPVFDGTTLTYMYR